MEKTALVAIRGGVLSIEPHRMGKIIEGPFVFAGLLIHFRPITVGFGGRGIQAQRLSQVRQGLLLVAEFGMRQPAPVKGLGIVRLPRNSLTKVLQSRYVVTSLPQGGTAHKVSQ